LLLKLTVKAEVLIHKGITTKKHSKEFLTQFIVLKECKYLYQQIMGRKGHSRNTKEREVQGKGRKPLMLKRKSDEVVGLIKTTSCSTTRLRMELREVIYLESG